MTEELVKEPEATHKSSIIDKRYPIGSFQYDLPLTEEQVPEMIKTIEEFPERLKNLVSKYSDQQLDIPYRDDGWTLRQVVHHIADSHMNAYIRFKLALTEDKPTVKPYNEKAWAEMIDSKTLPVDISLSLITSIHKRWSVILKAMGPAEFARTFFHPEHMKLHDLLEILAMYTWHCNHHYAHIQLIEPARQEAKSKNGPVKKSSVKKTAKSTTPKRKTKKTES